MPSIRVYQFHTRNICITISKVDHIPKWNSYIFWREIIINTGIIDIKHTFFNSEKELCFICIVDNLRWPYGNSTFIIIKRTGVYLFKRTVFCNFCSFYHFFKSR